jgi:hypothetical protein
LNGGFCFLSGPDDATGKPLSRAVDHPPIRANQRQEAD